MNTRPSLPLARVIKRIEAGGWVPVSRHNAVRLVTAHPDIRVQARDFMTRTWREFTYETVAPLKPRTVFRACTKE